jgi:SAM-dependent methyltransferase
VEAHEPHVPLAGPASLPALATRATVLLFGAAIFLAAALLFVVEPMVAKMLLPSFGGTPGVWAVSLVFFQAVLLAGYAFAHYSVRVAGLRRQVLLQLALLLPPFIVLPIAVSAGSSAATSGVPELHLLVALGAAVGLPFLVVTTASPVLQRWFAAVGDRSSRDPYFLYAASNVGSILGLLAYPALIEPRLTLHEQALYWGLGYSVFVILAAVCAWRVLATAGAASAAPAAPQSRARPVGARVGLRWIAMAALPSSLMLGTTTHLSTDIAAVPLLWVIPLGLYLLSFVVAFAKRPPLSLRALSWTAAVSSLLLAVSLLPLAHTFVWGAVAIHAANLFFVAAMVHRRLALERPAPEQLTQFYLLLSLGGVVGGAFSALLAPVLFSSVYEYPIAIVLALMLRPGPCRPRRGVGPLRRNADLLLPFGLLVVVLALAKALPAAGTTVLFAATVLLIGMWARRPVRFALAVGSLLLLTAVPPPALHAERTFFGVLRVVTDGKQHVFWHGTTVHGVESFAPGQRDEPLSYYARQGPLGQLFARLPRQPRNVAVVGLGAGTTAAYGRPGDRFTFYEIDKAVVRIASNPRYFTFLHDSKAAVGIVVGDGRLQLATAPDSSYDLIVLDAFSSDAVPVHLLTREAVQLYLRKLRPGGVIAFNLSNRYLDLEPVIDGIDRSLGLSGLAQTHMPSDDARRHGVAASIWAMVGRQSGDLEQLAGDPRWKPLRRDPGARVWTDEYSNILSVIKWHR